MPRRLSHDNLPRRIQHHDLRDTGRLDVRETGLRVGRGREEGGFVWFACFRGGGTVHGEADLVGQGRELEREESLADCSYDEEGWDGKDGIVQQAGYL